MSPRCRRDVAAMSPRCRRDAAESPTVAQERVRIGEAGAAGRRRSSVVGHDRGPPSGHPLPLRPQQTGALLQDAGRVWRLPWHWQKVRERNSEQKGLTWSQLCHSEQTLTEQLLTYLGYWFLIDSFVAIDVSKEEICSTFLWIDFFATSAVLVRVVLVISTQYTLIMFITICLQKLISSGTAFNSFRFIGTGPTFIRGAVRELYNAAWASPCHKRGEGGLAPKTFFFIWFPIVIKTYFIFRFS